MYASLCFVQILWHYCIEEPIAQKKGYRDDQINIKGREPQLPTTLSSPVTKDNFMIIEFSENDKKNFNKASTIQDAYAEWERSLDLSSIPCPSCSTVGCLCRYDHYDRVLICSAEDIDDPARLSILVVKAPLPQPRSNTELPADASISSVTSLPC